MWRLPAGSVAVALACLPLGACSPASSGTATIRVSRPVSLVGSVVRVKVSGVPAGREVGVVARTRSAEGIRFSSRETFRADARGEVVLSRDPAIGGSYRGVSPMGLLWAMRPEGSSRGSEGYSDRVDPKGQTVKVTVDLDGQPVASTSFRRRAASPGVHARDLSLPQTGFDGIFYRPAETATPRPGVVLLGGSEGGLPDTLEAQLLASHGYPTLALAYFKGPGLPAQLTSIPLEYFAKALRWLGRQHGVDSGRLVVSGVSRGSEAALLLGTRYPGLVHAVIALAPSNVALCGYPDCAEPAWTWHGRPVPYSQLAGPSSPNPDATIPVEDISGPVLLVCGGADQVWPSCPMAKAVVRRLRTRGGAHRHVLLSYPHADHHIGTLIPNIAYRVPGTDGATWTADMQARTHAWPTVLTFLRDLQQGGS